MKSHEVDFKIYGDDLQYVQIGLDPDETVVAEAGSMMAMEDGLNFEAKLGDGSEPDKGFFGSLLDVGKRVLTNESIFMTHFTNESSKKKNVYFAAPYPGKIIPVEFNLLEDFCYQQHIPEGKLGELIQFHQGKAPPPIELKDSKFRPEDFRLFVDVANADGEVSMSELRMLKKVLRKLQETYPDLRGRSVKDYLL